MVLSLREIPIDLSEHSLDLDHNLQRDDATATWFCRTCADRKVAICEYLLSVNEQTPDHPFIAPTAIDWLGDGMVKALAEADKKAQS